MTSEKLSAHNKSRNPVVLFGDGITSLGVIRGLRDLGVEIFMVSDTGKGIGKYSKYVNEVFVIHPTDSDYVVKVIDWIKASLSEKPVLMVAGNDDALELLSKEHKLLCEFAVPTFPSWEVVNKVINKEFMYKIASIAGIPTIATQRINSLRELEVYFQSDNNTSFPVFLKSSNSAKFSYKYGTKGVVCYSEIEVFEAYRKYDGFIDGLLLQDFLPGDIDQISAVLLVLNTNSEVIAVVANEKIRAARLFGSTTLSSSAWNQKMVEYAVILAETVGYVGFVGVQFKYDPRDNEFKFLEINGRFSVSVSLAQRCGVNMPEMVYKNFTGITFSRLENLQRNYQNNILLWWPLSDIFLLTQKRFYMDPLHYLSSLKGSGYIIEPFSWRDPMPALVTCVNFLLMSFNKFINKTQSMFQQKRKP
jgi:D-aspartate ligase